MSKGRWRTATTELDELAAHCPYCGEPITLLVDASAGAQAYVDDCAVCCRPIEVRVADAGERPAVRLLRDDEA